MGCGVSRHVVVDETMSSRKLQLEMDNKEGCINETSTEINNLLEKLKEKDKLIEELQRGAVTQINSLQDEKEEVAQEVSRPIIIDGGVDESVRTVTEITEQTDGLDNKAETYELEDQFQNTQNVQQQESEQCSEEELSEIHRLNKCIRELKERVLCLEYQQLVLKQIKNAKKLRELEELPHKPVEFEDIICKIKEDAATIAEDLKKRDAFERQAATLSSETNIALSFTGHLQRVKDLYEQLTEKLVAKPVAAVMYQGDVLSMKELESIQNCNSCDAASKLLNCLLQQPVVGMVECFMEALKSTNQHHIFLWISFSDYEINSEHTECIRHNYVLLLEILNVQNSSLIAQLLAARVIDFREKEELESANCSTHRIQRLLSMLSRKSSSQFEDFLKILDKTGQGHIAKALRVEHSIVTETSTPSLRHVIGRGVAAVTSADGRLYVLLYQNSERIEVYDLNTFKQLRTLHVTGVSTDTWDRGLIACTINKCLYVSDCDRNRVFRVDLTEDKPEIINWQVGLNPTGLSLNTERNLLVACWNSMTIEECTTRGTAVREIRLQSSDDRPLHPVHAIQLTSGQFVVCCCDGSKEMYDVVEVDSHGRVVYSYRTQLQSSISQNYSYMPRHLAVDKSNKCILVADCGNDKIVILSRSLKFDAHDLIDATSVDGGFRSPSCLDFDESEGRLCFNEMSGRIFVFSNVFNIADSFQ